MEKILLGLFLFAVLTIGFASDANTVATIKLTPANIKIAGIQVETLSPTPMTRYIMVPGEIIPNQNQTAIVAPRIQAQVVKRLVNTGQSVVKGQPLVELSSVAVAAAQAELLINANEWQRFQKLGTDIVTKKSYEEAEIQFRQAYSKLLAFGLTEQQIKAFISSKQANRANGDFTLLAPISGTVSSAKIILGQMLDPGAEIYQITNENTLWVNALLSADNPNAVKVGNKAIIETGKKSVTGSVIQIHHQLDKTTRTQTVQIQINNPNDEFHPGEFVTCRIAIGQSKPVLAIPVSAVIQSADGDKVIFVEQKPDEFLPKEVHVLYIQNGKAVVSGVSAGVKVVTKGAFFINSEMLKAGFDAHNH